MMLVARHSFLPGLRGGRFVVALCLGVGLGLATAGRAGESSAGKVDFDRDIRPILAENCYACHGPDENKRKAGLRLDLKEGAFQRLKSDNVAVVPGHPEKSALIERITAQDEDDRMPPLKTGKRLTPPQVDLLRRWIAEGAAWKTHWAYTKPERPAVPQVKNKRWPKNEIDSFVLARLEQEQLAPSPEADKRTLARRATLDLTGLPPTPQEVDAFLADNTPQAYEKLVDRLLASPRYGEQMARYWLDAARYADSHGYHIDSERSIWKYREWVINAFHRNEPFDQFTTEQLAGDLLTNATTEQKIASGYVRCNMSTGEGGAIKEEYQAKYTFDRVETMSTTWLGLTMTCARCHSHKYDPITQREYYGLYAFFNNLDESVMDGNKPNPDPFLKVPTPEQTNRLAQLHQRIEQGQRQLDAPRPDLDARQSAWQRRWHERLAQGWTGLVPHSARSLVTNGAELKILDDRSVLAVGPNPPADEFEITAPLAEGTLAAVRLETLPHESLPHQRSGRAKDGQFRLGEIEAEILPPARDGQPVAPIKLKFTRAIADADQPKFPGDKAIDGKADTGWGVGPKAAGEPHAALFVLGAPVAVARDSRLRVRLDFAVSKLSQALGRFRLSAGQGAGLVQALNPTRFEPWHVIGPFKSDNPKAALAADYPPEREIDLKQSYPGVRDPVRWEKKPDFEDEQSNLLVADLHGVHGVRYLYRTVNLPHPQELEISLQADGLLKLWVNGRLALERDHAQSIGEPPPTTTVTLNRGENKLLAKIVTVQGAANFTFRHAVAGEDDLSGEVAGLLALTGEPTGANATRVRDFFRRQHSPEFKKLYDEVAQLRRESEAIDKAIPTTLIARELATNRETVLLIRGEYDKPGERVSAGVPAILPPFPKGAPTNRLGLAEWLLAPSHPLTARVTVNRFWQQHFGVGLVKTVDDFGVQGDKPSHPELLDWLATEFLRTGWDVKRMQRLIVTSATYRQSSRASPALRARDPENRLLARGPRFRLDAEEVRDQALFVSGLLVDRIGGPSVKPYEPPGLWEAVSFNNAQKYVPDTGEGRYRRSLYTYWKRQSPPPNMLIFDAPTREYCTVRRARSNTPLQALALLNDPQLVEASRALAQRILLEGGNDSRQRLAYAFELAVARKPSGDEAKVLLDVLQQELADFRASKASARALLEVGDFKAAANLDLSELAAWTTIASLILNLDETITKG
jgi:hypothetical protein